VKERKTKGVKTFSELARPLTGAYVYLCGHRVRAHPASSAAIKLPFPIGEEVRERDKCGRPPPLHSQKRLWPNLKRRQNPAAAPVVVFTNARTLQQSFGTSLVCSSSYVHKR